MDQKLKQDLKGRRNKDRYFIIQAINKMVPWQMLICMFYICNLNKLFFSL